MKYLLLLITAFLLQSCVPSDILPHGESADNSKSQGELYTSEFLESLKFDNLTGGIMDTSLQHICDKTNPQADTGNFMAVYITSDEHTHILYRSSSGSADTVEIYENHDYSSPVRVITLQDMSNKRQNCFGLSWDSGTDTYDVLVNEKTDGGYPAYLYRFDGSGNNTGRYEIDINLAEPVLCSKGIVYTVKNNGIIGNCGNLLMINPQTGDTFTVDRDVYDCFTASDGIIYYIKRYVKADFTFANMLCSYNPENNSSEEIMIIETQRDIASAVYDSENGIVYYTDASQSSVYAYYNNDEKQVVSTAKIDIEIVGTSSGSILIETNEGVVSAYELTPKPEKIEEEQIVLKICCLHDDEEKYLRMHEDILEDMRAAGIYVKLEVAFMSLDNDEYQNTMAKKLLAGDDDFDLIELTPALTTLMDEKYYADLEKYSILKEYIDAYIPGMKELCTVNSKTVFAPDNPLMKCLNIDKSLISDEITVPTTFDELFEDHTLTDSIYYYGEYSEKFVIRTWFEELASNYMTKTISDDTAQSDLCKMFTYIRDIQSYEDIYIGEDYRTHELFVQTSNNNGRPGYGTDDYYAVLPKLGNDYKYSVSGDFLAVNENSANKEEAIAFLAYYFNNSMNDTGNFRMLFYEGGYEKLYPDISGFDNKYDIFTAQIADSIRTVDVDGYITMIFGKGGFIDNIISGEITPEEAAEKTVRYLKMIRDE